MSDSFILYTSDYQLIEGLTDEQLGQLTRALFIYARDGEVINLEPVVRMAFVFIKDKIDRNQQKYQKKCERNMKHDKDVTAMFEARGWKVLRIWECELKKRNETILVEKIQSILSRSSERTQR